jgi:hypothetical protein
MGIDEQKPNTKNTDKGDDQQGGSNNYVEIRKYLRERRKDKKPNTVRYGSVQKIFLSPLAHANISTTLLRSKLDKLVGASRHKVSFKSNEYLQPF